MNKVHKSNHMLVLYQNKSDFKVHSKDYDLHKLVQIEMCCKCSYGSSMSQFLSAQKLLDFCLPLDNHQ